MLNLLFTSQDPGGTQTIMPVMRQLRLQNNGQKCFFAASRNQNFLEEIAAYCDILQVDRPSSYGEIMNHVHPEVVITGTSNPDAIHPTTPEQFLHALCKKYGVPSICLLDFWGNYAPRFADYGGDLNPDYVPTKICALDELSKNGLVAIGIDISKILVTHNPYFDAIVAECQKPSPPRKTENKIRILYISQPHFERNGKTSLGYDQFTNFLALLEGLSSWRHKDVKEIFVWIHPLEDKKRWEDFIAGGRSDISISISSDRDRRFINEMNLVCSAYSTSFYRFLYHAMPCISLQVGLKRKDQLITNELGLTIPIYSHKQLRETFSQLDLARETKRLKKRKKVLSEQGLFFSKGMATQKVLKVIRSLMQDTSKTSLAGYYA